MLQTLERTHTFDARVLTADNAAALRTLTGPGGLPLLPCLHPAKTSCRPPPRCCRSMPRTRCRPACAPPVTGQTGRARC